MARTHDSVEVKELRGTIRADRQVSGDIDFTTVDKIPDCPYYFDTDRINLWNKLADELIKAKILKAPDLMALELLVDNLIRYRQSAEKLVNGDFVAIIKGKPVPNPYIKINKTASETCVKLFAHFGFTPSMRIRLMNINSAPSDQPDVLAELFGQPSKPLPNA